MLTLPLSLSVFFPAYNEEDNIEQTVHEADRVLKNLVREHEIIIVNDGSKDSTGVIADRLAKENSRVRVVHHNQNQGYGAAVWSGVQAARYDYVFFTDADLQFKLEEISKLLKFVPEYEVVIGYRAQRMDPFMRLANAKGWNILNRLLFGLRVKDIDCAFKLFKREVIQDLPVQSRGAMLSAELLIRLQRQGIIFKEIPVTHLPRVMGSPTGAKPAVILRAFKEMIRVYRGELGNGNFVAAGKFALVGVMNTLVDWMAYYSLTRGTLVFAEHLAAAKTFSFLLGTITSFIANRYWTFEMRSPIRAYELVKFYITAVTALIINVATLYILTSIFGVYDLLAVLVATIVSFGVEFHTFKILGI